MRSSEVFYLHIHGEQRGPYTVQHIDHLLNSGLINEDALFWREGLEQWQAVTDLVELRRPKNRWKWPVIFLSVLLVLGSLGYLLAPIAWEGWREIYQHNYSQEAAYWRARDAVRTYCVPQDGFVVFEPFPEAEVQLGADSRAVAVVRGTLHRPGGVSRSTAWRVQLRFNKAAREWSPSEAAEVLAP
jgi:hypothetical protein